MGVVALNFVTGELSTVLGVVRHIGNRIWKAEWG